MNLFNTRYLVRITYADGRCREHHTNDPMLAAERLGDALRDGHQAILHDRGAVLSAVTSWDGAR